MESWCRGEVEICSCLPYERPHCRCTHFILSEEKPEVGSPIFRLACLSLPVLIIYSDTACMRTRGSPQPCNPYGHRDSSRSNRNILRGSPRFASTCPRTGAPADPSCHSRHWCRLNRINLLWGHQGCFVGFYFAC